MFTGLIEFVFPIVIENTKLYLYVNQQFIKLVKPGDSICINGICLTVVSIHDLIITFDLTQETLNKTNLSLIGEKSYANVELSLKYGDRLGGHIITGHIFCTGIVSKFDSVSGDLEITLDGEYVKYLKYKGSVAINGVSLTIAEVKEKGFRIALIPETIKRTTFQYLQRREIVNIEFDLPNSSSYSSSYTAKYMTLEKQIEENDDGGDLSFTNIDDLSFTNIDDICFTNIYSAIDAFKNGSFVIVMDDEGRENEGDLIVAATHITEDQMTQMINDTTGIICTPMTENRAKRLGLIPMVQNNTDPNRTAFTVTVDHINCGTGVSSSDRLTTVRSLVHSSTNPNDLRRPGHIFPLVANRRGLEGRRGHTEAAVALCQLANIYPPVAVIGELKNGDGTMKRKRDCFRYAQQFNLPIITIDQLSSLISPKLKLLAQCQLQTKIGEHKWQFYCFDSGNYDRPHKVLTYGISSNENNEENNEENIVLRIHSECFTGDVLQSSHCDCGDQLKLARQYIVNKGKGLIIFPSEHEGRGIGLVEKVKAYAIQQEKSVDTFTANHLLGYEDDLRNYDIVSDILKYFNITKVELLSQNPNKIIPQVSVVTPLKAELTDCNKKYLNDKQEYFENLMNVNDWMNINGLVNVKGLEQKEVFPHINLSDFYEKNNTQDFKVAIVHSSWHLEYIQQINNILESHLAKFGIIPDKHSVPGSNEIPMLASKIAKDYDGIICVGILIKGDTLHFENVSTAVSNGIMQAQIMTGVPILNCILSCLNFDQVRDRIDGPKSTLEYIVHSTLYMINKCKR